MSILDTLLHKRSYVDPNSHLLIVVARNAPQTAAEFPEKYTRTLQVLSYRYEVCRKTAAGVQQASTTELNTEKVVQQLARYLLYLDNVRQAYITRSGQNNVFDPDWFSPELEYHLWLDYVEQAYHSGARTSMKNRVGVTYAKVVKRQGPQILSYSKPIQSSRKKYWMIQRFSQLG